MNIPELPAAAFMRLDLFPADVTGEVITGGVIHKVRILITDAHVHLLRLTPTGDVELAYSFELDAVSLVDGRRERGYSVLTADGHDLVVKRSSGCGCGMQRLKGARLFSYPVPHAAITS